MRDPKRHRQGITRRRFLGGTAIAGLYLTGCGITGDGDNGEDPGGGKGDNGDEVTDRVIVRAAIHPGIGVARVGNSNDYFVGPEVVEPPLTQRGESRDAAGAIKRQAARFRIFGYNAAGQVVRELTADNAEIEWTAELANKKASWYRFLVALDLPEAAAVSAPRRNAAVAGAGRAALEITPGPRTITGKRTSGAAYRFDSGRFLDTPVSLGELRTDDAGRLLVLGGLGKSGSPRNTPVFDPNDLDTFNNADGWYDDIGDGPVSAKVTIDGRAVPVESSWVVVAPPNYAPNVISWRTLYDLLTDTYVAAGMLPMPAQTSFTEDVLPILRRLSNLQWVNKGFADTFGRGGAYDFDDPELVAKLAAAPTGSDPHGALRREIVGAFRTRESASEPRQWPWLYGDAFGSFDDSPRVNLAVSELRTVHLRRWADGDFIADWNPQAQAPQSFDQVPLAKRPAMLDRAALHFCLADAFHPGCELTWPMRHASMYSAPFRIKQRPADVAAADPGTHLTADNALAPNGALHAQGPGELTRWMAVPWQGDTVFCRSGYDPEFDPYIPTFWPARVPNHVLTDAEYATVMNTGLSRTERVAAFKTRQSWVRSMTGTAPNQILKMVASFGAMGVVEARPGVANDPDLPPVLLVESRPGTQLLVAAEPTAAIAGDPIREAGWESAEQLEEFQRIVGRRR